MPFGLFCSKMDFSIFPLSPGNAAILIKKSESTKKPPPAGGRQIFLPGVGILSTHVGGKHGPTFCYDFV
jgi:hypothetical protein